MSKLISFIAVVSVCVGLGITPAAAAGDKSVTLNLGGSFCDFYPDEITAALKKLAGVKSVDAKSGQKFVIVQYDAGQVTPDKMVTAVKGVKGAMWHCDASVK